MGGQAGTVVAACAAWLLHLRRSRPCKRGRHAVELSVSRDLGEQVGIAPIIFERDILEGQSAADMIEHKRIALVAKLNREVDDLEDALEADQGRGKIDRAIGELLECPVQVVQVGAKGNDRTNRERVL